jgi:hypothetical protein
MSDDPYQDPRRRQQLIEAILAAPPQRRAAPLAAWFMLTAVMAAHFAVLAPALAGRDWNNDFLSLLGWLVVGCGTGVTLGAISGLFDQSPLRGGILGGIMGSLVGITAVFAAEIPENRINLAFHTSALAALCILAAAVVGRWQR